MCFQRYKAYPNRAEKAKNMVKIRLNPSDPICVRPHLPRADKKKNYKKDWPAELVSKISGQNGISVACFSVTGLRRGVGFPQPQTGPGIPISWPAEKGGLLTENSLFQDEGKWGFGTPKPSFPGSGDSGLFWDWGNPNHGLQQSNILGCIKTCYSKPEARELMLGLLVFESRIANH